MQPNKQDRVWCHSKSWQLRFVMTGSNSSSSTLLAMDSLTSKSLFSKWKSKLSYLEGRGFLLWGIHPRPPCILNTPRAESDLADFHCYLYGGLGQGLWQVALLPKSDDSLRSGHCCVPAKNPNYGRLCNLPSWASGRARAWTQCLWLQSKRLSQPDKQSELHREPRGPLDPNAHFLSTACWALSSLLSVRQTPSPTEGLRAEVAKSKRTKVSRGLTHLFLSLMYKEFFPFERNF